GGLRRRAARPHPPAPGTHRPPGRATRTGTHSGGRVPRADRTEPAMTAHAGASPWPVRVLSHAGFEMRNLLRNGEQLLLTLILPAIVLVVLVRTDLIRLDLGGQEPVRSPPPACSRWRSCPQRSPPTPSPPGSTGGPARCSCWPPLPWVAAGCSAARWWGCSP